MLLLRRSRGDAGNARSAREAGLQTISFGNDVWMYGEASSWRSAAARAASGRERPSEIEDGRLHVVTQIGDAFERAYPRARILANHGRYLLVDLAPSAAARASRDACFRIEPVKGDVEVFRVVTPPIAARASGTQALVDLVSRANLETTLRTLAGFPTRHSTSAAFLQAVDFAEGQLRSFGLTTSRQTISVSGHPSLNLIAEKRGTNASGRVMLVTAHLDSINIPGGPAAAAPGADDNGSGAAGVIEIARCLAGAPAEDSLRFILFGGEEEGLFGSLQHVAALDAAERARISTVINMDMIGTRNGNVRGVLLEGGQVSQPLMDSLASAAATYTSLQVQTSLNPFNSDHVPFIDAGIAAVLTIEAADQSNQNIHSANDTLEHIDFDLLTAIVRMNVACAAEQVRARKEEAPVPTEEKMQISGRYKFNGGVATRSGRGFADRARNNPLYRISEPIYIAQRADTAPGARFTLHVDAGAPDSLNVVSGIIAGPSGDTHFIGRATSAPNASGVHIDVADLSFDWPGTTNTVTSATLDLSTTPLTGLIAQTLFIAGTETYGPYAAQFLSPFFREVEVDVDRESGAINIEPVSTHIHPDRPPDLALEELTMEKAFGKAGIKITRASDTAADISSTDAGGDHRWAYQELHDSMVLHWQAFANRPQWKMWVFLGNRATDDGLGGVMFDGDIDEPGGVDRQGTAIFTQCPYFHTTAGGYIVANPPVDEAVRRELFFNLIHETGHAFNLAHSFDKAEGAGWAAPPWAPMSAKDQALSWMNYPDQATPAPRAGANASWFYNRFRFQFDTDELLFLRHAPAMNVEMGANAWFDNHGRAARETVDPRLRLVLRHRKEVVELGEPVLCELRLENVGPEPVPVHTNLDPSDGYVQIAVTSPSGKRRPYITFDHTRRTIEYQMLKSGERVYQAIDLTLGVYGFPFKEPGPYRIEAVYRNADGRTASAVASLYVCPPSSYAAMPAIQDLFDADIGRVLYVEGTQVMDDVNDKMLRIEKKLADAIGPENPVAMHLRTTRNQPLARGGNVIGADGKAFACKKDPERFVAAMEGMLVSKPERTADTMGHIWYRQVVDEYSAAATGANRELDALKAQEVLYGLFKTRGVVQNVLDEIAAKVGTLQKRTRTSKRVTDQPRGTT